MVQNHAPTGLCQMVDIGSQHGVTLFGQLNMFVHHMHDYIAILCAMLGFDAKLHRRGISENRLPALLDGVTPN
jgi:hypothetical protein